MVRAAHRMRRGLALALLCFMLPSFATNITISNTALLEYDDPNSVPTQVNSNTVTTEVSPPPTPATIEFYRYTPPTGELNVLANDTQCMMGAAYQMAPPPTTLGGSVIDTSALVPLNATTSYRAGEPMFVGLDDGNRNKDSTLREYVEIDLTTSAGEHEKLKLLETGIDTGVFMGVINTVRPPPGIVQMDCVLSIQIGTKLKADYTDSDYPSDHADVDILVDPFGIIFDSSTGAPVNGVTVSLVNALTNLPAAVFDDDGVTPYPSVIVSGGTVVAGSNTYTMPTGGYRFPLIAPGNYKLVITNLPTNFIWPTNVPLPTLQSLLNPDGDPYSLPTGYDGSTFTIVAGPPLNIDMPIDPIISSLILSKAAAKSDVSTGDFIRYELSLRNNGLAQANDVLIKDIQPRGFRFQKGSLRVDGVKTADPKISSDGRTLSISIGNLAASEDRRITYVAEVTSGTDTGMATNYATASRTNGAASNQAQASVYVRDAFFASHAIIIGRVFEAPSCDADMQDPKIKGIPKVKIMMEDGTYVITDDEGRYHFEKVSPGTHVVQLDKGTIPQNYEVLACDKNTRFAGKAHSQFVDVQGGTLWKADFYLAPKRVPTGTLKIDFKGEVLKSDVTKIEVKKVEAKPDLAEVLRFDTLSSQNTNFEKLIEKIKTINAERKIAFIHVIGNTDNHKIAGNATKVFKDNWVLSQARASLVASALVKANLGIQTSVEGRADTVPVASNDTPEGRALNRRTDVLIYFDTGEVSNELLYTLQVAAASNTKDIQFVLTLPPGLSYMPQSAIWKEGTPVEAESLGQQIKFKVPHLAGGQKRALTFRAVSTAEKPLAVKACLDDEQRADLYSRFTTEGYNEETLVMTQTPTCNLKDAPVNESQIKKQNVAAPVLDNIIDDITASGGGDKDWITGQSPGIDLLFPSENHNPRSPSTRIMIKHGAAQKIDLRLNGETVPNLYFERIIENSDKTILVSEWKGVPLVEGDNFIEAAITDNDGTQLQTLKRIIHYANTPAKIVFLPEQSKLIANGIDRPRIAIRVLDKFGKPVRKRSGGTFNVSAPYLSAEFEDATQRRQLSALDKMEPEYRIETDDGIAYIDLAATDVAGEVKVKFYISENNTYEISTWLEPQVRDWVVVGFAEGTAGYKTLKGNMQDLPDADKNNELDTDGQTKLYAKGRVTGEWIMTAAFDSAKERNAKQNNFKGIVDPGEFYTLYGDTTTQKSDAASSDKLFLKIEKSRFYALFGDYDAGLNDTELGRYNRSFTGIKSEYSGRFIGFKIFGTQLESNYFKEEIQGRGESFLYRLSKGNILVNSEKIRLVVRDRFQSDKIIKETSFSNHVDYTIDYRAGTINFKQRIDSFIDFNPQFLVIEYEVMGTATKDFTYGGRLEGKVFDDKLKVGVTHIEESDGLKEGQLQSIDTKIKLAEESELKIEAAQSDSKPATVELKGSAYLAELAHRSKLIDVSTYLRKTEQNFGLGQQAASESGSFKTGARSSLHLNTKWDLNAAYDHQKQLTSDHQRDVASSELKYKHETGSFGFGFQRIDETSALGSGYSNQATGEITQNFFKNKLELQLMTEQNLGSSAKSVDYPNRYILQAGYRLTDKTKVFAAQEYTNGQNFDTSTTRLGLESTPWQGGKLGSTLNQSVSEAGPRTFSTMGLSQSLPLGAKWTLDASLDSSQTLRESGPATPLNPNHPIASGGFLGASGAYTEDYIAMSGGATYRAEPWSLNFRIENRMGDVEDKLGLATNVIRELSKGVVLGSTHEYYRSNYVGGADGQLFQGDFSLAYRPLDSRWTILDRLKYRYEMVDNAASLPIFGQTTMQGIDNAVSSALTNNFNLNRLSKTRKNQFSLFYGAKVAWDKYGDELYQSFTDLWGLEVRQDLTEKWDIGYQASVLHSWSAKNLKYSFGPSVGWSPVTNGWVSLGYNFKGFYDSDFDAARYTQQGLYLRVRVKFDETSLGLSKSSSEKNEIAKPIVAPIKTETKEAVVASPALPPVTAAPVVEKEIRDTEPKVTFSSGTPKPTPAIESPLPAPIEQDIPINVPEVSFSTEAPIPTPAIETSSPAPIEQDIPINTPEVSFSTEAPIPTPAIETPAPAPVEQDIPINTPEVSFSTEAPIPTPDFENLSPATVVQEPNASLPTVTFSHGAPAIVTRSPATVEQDAPIIAPKATLPKRAPIAKPKIKTRSPALVEQDIPAIKPEATSSKVPIDNSFNQLL